MSEVSELSDRAAFAERLRTQLQARYPALHAEVDGARFALRLTGPGVDAHLPLTALHTACLREPRRTSALIADFVRQAESGLTPSSPVPLSLSRLVWCVRTTGYVREHSRGGDLLVSPVAGSLVAFVAESLPNSIMRGIPREEWATAGEDRVRRAADEGTAARLRGYAQPIRSAERVARDGWSFSGDSLFMGSLLLVPDVLRALVDRAGGDVLLAHPDRGLVLAIGADAEAAGAFRQRALRTFREALNPVSRELLVTDGERLTAEVRGREARPSLLRRLRG